MLTAECAQLRHQPALRAPDDAFAPASAVVAKLIAGTALCYAEYDLRSGIEGCVSGDARANSADARANPIMVTSCRPSFYAPSSLGIRYTRSFIHACTFLPFITFLLTSHFPLTT